MTESFDDRVKRVFVSELADDILIQSEPGLSKIHSWAQRRATLIVYLARRLDLDAEQLHYLAIKETQRRQAVLPLEVE